MPILPQSTDAPAPVFHPLQPFQPTEFHPEFGYAVPSREVGRKAWLVCKSIAFGAVVGAIGIIAVTRDNDPPGVRVVTTTEAPVIRSMAAAAVGQQPAVGPATSHPALSVIPVVSVQPDAAAAFAAERPQPLVPDVAVAKQKRKAAPKHRRNFARRNPEPDPRDAYARAPGRFPEQLQRQWPPQRNFNWGW
jgi:hypothetical protein